MKGKNKVLEAFWNKIKHDQYVPSVKFSTIGQEEKLVSIIKLFGVNCK